MESLISYSDQLLSGVWITVSLSLSSVVLAMAIGLMGAIAKTSDRALPRKLATAYTTIIRSIPDLCLMLLLYYGGQELVNLVGDVTGWWRYLEINQFVAGTVTIGIIFGAYMTETFRGALSSVPKGQFEASRALGMTSKRAFYRIILPQLFYYALPSFGNNWLVLLKTTALVSVIGLQDLVWQAFVAGRATNELFTFFFATLGIYLVLTFLSDIALSLAETRLSPGFRRRSM